jgi:hypothetical protein
MSVQHNAEETAEGCAEAEMPENALMIWQQHNIKPGETKVRPVREINIPYQDIRS